MSPAAPALKRPDGTNVRVLVVDDESNLTELLSMALRYEGWDIKSAATGNAAVKTAKEFKPDAVVLDMMLPDFDGLEVLRRMRDEDPTLPVLFLTARDAVEDRVAGLTAGGDDYVTKPFSLEEVVARVRALLRRSVQLQEEESSLLRVGDLTLDEDSHEVMRGDEEITLTATEFELLRFLMRNPKRVLSKAQILDRVWHYDFGGQANVVELYISYLRKKIDAGRVPLIHTMHTMARVKNAQLADGDTPEPAGREIGEEQVVTAATKLVANTPGEARELIELYGADSSKVEVVTPEDYLGDVMGDVSRRRGILQGQDDSPSGKIINAMIPLGEMFGYATTLRSMSQGRATFSMEFDHYAEAPANIAETVTKK